MNNVIMGMNRWTKRMALRLGLVYVLYFFFCEGAWNALSPENYIKAPGEGKKIQHTPHHTNSRDTNLHKGPYKTLNSKEKPLDPLILPAAAALSDPPESGKSCNAKESPAK